MPSELNIMSVLLEVDQSQNPWSKALNVYCACVHV